MESWGSIWRNLVSSFQRDREPEEESTTTVTINNPRMKIKGKVCNEPDISYVAFLGVPYACPPLGPLRFAPPKPLPRGSLFRQRTVIEAYDEPNVCIQFQSQGESEFVGDEDCLYLNIYTPGKPKDINGKLPVLVFIHGGGFEGGSGNLEVVKPNNIMKEESILVTVNYRLGILGFLNMRSDNCRGNAGLKDQVMALRWIRKNIAQFKGNAKNVILCGQSSGGTCVNLHMLSPLSKGLFHKAIIMSGGVYTPWGSDGHAREIKELFKKNKNELTRVLVETFKQESAENLLRLSNQIKDEEMKPFRLTVFLRPSIEYIQENAFLPEPVESLMAKAKPVPTIAGITKQEGYMFFCSSIEMDYSLVARNDQLFSTFLQQNFPWSDATASECSRTLKTMYFPDDDQMSNAEINEQLATLVTDILFRRFYDNFKIGSLSTSGWPPFYVYQFEYFSGVPILPDADLNVVHRAAAHCDDMFFLFAPNDLENALRRFLPENVEEVRRQMQIVTHNIRQLLGSFCRGGVPRRRLEGEADFEWKPHTEEDPCYLILDRTLTMQNGRLNDERWSALNEVCHPDLELRSLASSPQTPEPIFGQP